MIIITKYYLPETSLVQAGTSEQSCNICNFQNLDHTIKF
jgi:hypothetical protein